MQALLTTPRASLAFQGSPVPASISRAKVSGSRRAQLISTKCMNKGADQASQVAMSRRMVMPAFLLAPTLFANQAEAAGSARDMVKGFLRPSAVDPEDAVVQLMDARGTLLELQNISATPMDSQERFDARVILPGMASALRKVQDAAPSALRLIGSDAEASLGSRYGGESGEEVGEELGAVYKGVGQVLTISGRTIKAEAIEPGTTTCANAARAIDSLLELLPASAIDKANEKRRQRREAALAK